MANPELVPGTVSVVAGTASVADGDVDVLLADALGLPLADAESLAVLAPLDLEYIDSYAMPVGSKY